MEKLITTLPKKPFQKWGLDFIGPINRWTVTMPIDTF
jgi:hypothetical protein